MKVQRELQSKKAVYLKTAFLWVICVKFVYQTNNFKTNFMPLF